MKKLPLEHFSSLASYLISSRWRSRRNRSFSKGRRVSNDGYHDREMWWDHRPQQRALLSRRVERRREKKNCNKGYTLGTSEWIRTAKYGEMHTDGREVVMKIHRECRDSSTSEGGLEEQCDLNVTSSFGTILKHFFRAIFSKL